jgi:UDP:flavonoid glycosyltransferase YjiC (YdhE family)
MKVLMLSLGTRGDCEPFLGVGEMLRERGEDVVCAFPEQYRELAESSGFRFLSLGSAFIDLLDSEDSRNAISGKGLKRVAATFRTAMASLPTQKEVISCQREIIEKENPDVIIFHPKAVYPVVHYLETGKRAILLGTVPQMLHEVEGRPHVGLDGLPTKLSYTIANFGFAKSAMLAANMFYKGKYNAKQLQDAILKLPIFYTVSPQIFPRPEYWGANAIVVGFWERDKTVGWQPPPEIARFIENHGKILFVTFGSMTNRDPAGNTAIIADTLQELGIPAIMNT